MTDSSSSSMQPIDIQTDKLIDWCVNRGQLSADWLVSLQSVQSKVKNTLASPAIGIPLDVQRHVEEGGMTYWSLQSGLDLLSSQLLLSRGHSASDVGKLKNFFGRYTDPSLKALAALIGLYRTGNLFLAEGARLLSQSVKYDIPLLKKTLASNVKTSEDLRNKMSEEARSAREARKRCAESLAATWHIHSLSASNLDAQIRARAQTELPLLLNDLIQQAKQAKFGEAMEYYDAFVKFSTQQQPGETAASSSSAAAAAAAAFPSLQTLRAGDLMPLVSASSDSPAASSAASAAVVTDGGIDWGISVDGAGDAAGAGAAASAGEIDWGITSEGAGHDGSATTVTAGSIDWGDDSSSAEAGAGAAGATGEASAIDWDIETTDAGEDSANTTSTADSLAAASPSHSTTAAAASSTGAAAGDSPTSLLSDPFRHAVLAELLELESFLSERALDLSGASSGGGGGGDEVSVAAFAVPGTPHILRLQSAQSVGAYLQSVRGVLTGLRAPRLTQLLMVRSSRRFVDRLVVGVKQSLAGIERLDRSAVSSEARRQELAKTAARGAHELAALVARCRTLKTQVEAEISKLFQNRTVHIVGEINQMLQAAAASS